MTNIIRAEKATIDFVEGLSVDGYQMPNGEFRVGIASASLALGYPKNWLGRILDGESRNRNKTLQSLGFTRQIEKVVTNTSRGERESRTISIKDFNRLIAYAVSDGKKPALALQMALTEMALVDFFRDGFGQAPLSIEEKRKAFYLTYAKTINWLEEDKNDRQELYGWSSEA